MFWTSQASVLRYIFFSHFTDEFAHKENVYDCSYCVIHSTREKFIF